MPDIDNKARVFAFYQTLAEREPDQPLPMTMIGHVTSSYWSETLGCSIALALVEGGRKRDGQTLYLPMPDKTHAVTVAGTVFYDPDGERMRG